MMDTSSRLSKLRCSCWIRQQTEVYHSYTPEDSDASQTQIMYISGITRRRICSCKNANGSNFDTPDIVGLLVLILHTGGVVATSGFLTHYVSLYLTGVEVSPLISYAGENLEAICCGRTFHVPCEIIL